MAELGNVFAEVDMIRPWRALPLLALLACTDVATDDTSDTDTEPVGDGCPEGMREPREAGLFFSGFVVNGLSYIPVFTKNRVTEMDRPAACARPDGTAVDFIYRVNDDPYGRIGMSAPGPGLYALDGTQAIVELELYDPAVTFTNGSFVTGSWSVNEASAAAGFDSDLASSALHEGQAASISFSISATP